MSDCEYSQKSELCMCMYQWRSQTFILGGGGGGAKRETGPSEKFVPEQFIFKSCLIGTISKTALINEILQIKFLQYILVFLSRATYLISFSFGNVTCPPPPHFSTDLAFFRKCFFFRLGGGAVAPPCPLLATPLACI